MSNLYLTWQYNGVAPFADIVDWCEEHIPNICAYKHETIFFYTEEDMSFFLLKWDR